MTILNVISSPRQGSFSIQLADGIIEKLQTANPGSTVVVRDVATHPFPHLEEVHIQSIRSPAADHSPEQKEAARHSDEVIAEVKAADVIIIGAPMYNFGIPSTLKSWIDHLARANMTFRYTAEGPEGLVTGKKVYVALASGGVYSTGPAAAYDQVTPYLKTVLGFLGMTDVTVVRIEGLAKPDVQETGLAKALDNFTV